MMYHWDETEHVGQRSKHICVKLYNFFSPNLSTIGKGQVIGLAELVNFQMCSSCPLSESFEQTCSTIQEENYTHTSWPNEAFYSLFFPSPDNMAFFLSH